MERRVLVGALAAVMGGWVGGASIGAHASARVSAPPPALSGPSVPGAATRSLVRRDFQGRLVRGEAPVEERALELLALDAGALAPARAVIAERGRLLDQVLLDNFDLLLQAEATFAAGSGADKASFLLRLIDALAPVTRAGPLAAQVRAALPTARRAAFDRLLREYWDAVIADGRRGLGATADAMMGPVGGEPTPPVPGAAPKPLLAIVAQEQGEQLSLEVRRSFERQLKSGGVLFAYLTQGITLSPEQTTKVKAACEEFMARTGGNGTPIEHLRLAATVLPLLDTTQQARLVANATGRGVPKAYGRPADTSKDKGPGDPAMPDGPY